MHGGFLAAAAIVLDLEGRPLPLDKTAQTGALDRRDMDELSLAAVVGLDVGQAAVWVFDGSSIRAREPGTPSPIDLARLERCSL